MVLALGVAAIWGVRKARKLGKAYVETSGENGPPTTLAESVVSMSLMLAASAGCFFAWREAGSGSYLAASLGFLVLSPLWYRSPLSTKALFLAPLGGRVTPRRSFHGVDTLLAFTGYTLILVALIIHLSA